MKKTYAEYKKEQINKVLPNKRNDQQLASEYLGLEVY